MLSNYKEVFENNVNQKKADQISHNIATCFYSDNKPLTNVFPLTPYLLYKVSNESNPVDFQSICDGQINIDEDICLLAKEVLTEEIWNKLVRLTDEYSPYDFAITTVRFLNNLDKSDYNLSISPTISKLVNALLDIQENEKVADIYCGTGSYITPQALINNHSTYYGTETNKINSIITKIRAELINADIQIILGNVNSLTESSTLKFNKIFSSYPLILRGSKIKYNISFTERHISQYPYISSNVSSDWIFIKSLYELLEDNGKIAVLVMNSSLFTSNDISIRKHFIEERLIEYIISLPNKMLDRTAIPMTLLVLSKNNHSIKMVDATSLYKKNNYRNNEFTDENIETILDAITSESPYSKDVSIDEFRENDYNLNFAKYTVKDIILENPTSFEAVIKDISAGAHCTASQLEEMTTDKVTDCQYITLSNIQDGIIDDNLTFLSHIEPRFKKYCLKNNSLIISRNGSIPKIAVATIEDNQQILASSNMYIIQLDEEKVNPYFIQAFFSSSIGLAQLQSISGGGLLSILPLEYLKKIKIPLLPMEKQNIIAKEFQETLKEIKKCKIQLKNAVNKIQNVFNGEVK